MEPGLEPGSGLERWAYGALWAALAGSLALRAARRALGPGRGLVLPLALLAGLQSLCRACLPLPLGLALAAAAAGLLLWWASPRRLLPVAGRAVLVTGECGDTASTPRWPRPGLGLSGERGVPRLPVGCCKRVPPGCPPMPGAEWWHGHQLACASLLLHVQAELAGLYLLSPLLPSEEALGCCVGPCKRPP